MLAPRNAFTAAPLQVLAALVLKAHPEVMCSVVEPCEVTPKIHFRRSRESGSPVNKKLDSRFRGNDEFIEVPVRSIFSSSAYGKVP